MDKTIQKTIYKNLFGKTELKSNRVNLALVDDLREASNISYGEINLDEHIQLAQEFNNIRQEYLAKAEEVFLANEDLENFYSFQEEKLQALETEIERFTDSALEIGLDVSNNDDLNNAIQAYDKGQEELQKFLENRNLITESVTISNEAK